MVIILVTAILISVVVTTAILYIKDSHSYWKKLGVPSPASCSLFGNFGSPTDVDTHLMDKLQTFYEMGYKHIGLYVLTEPVYMPIDLELVKNIIGRDFNCFMSRGFYHNTRDDPLSAHLFSVDGTEWKRVRYKLTPTFTSGKIKMMFPQIVECGERMSKCISDSKAVIQVKDVLENFSMDVIGSCAFGIDCNTFTNPDSRFVQMGRNVFKHSAFGRFKRIFGYAFPNVARKLGVTLTPKDVSDFYLDVVKQAVEYRKANSVARHDFLQILTELEGSLTVQEIAAHAFVFFLGGFETSATAMAFCLFELTQAEAIQRRVREEVCEVLGRHGGKLTYEGCQELKYTEQVVEEALRKYPPVPVLIRRCTQQYTVPGTDVVLKKGMSVIISAKAIQWDPHHYPDPERFDPDRFSEENRKGRNPYTYLPFGEGPRICIGLRFGLLQVKMGLAHLLRDYHFTLNERTQLPLRMDPHSFIFSPLGGIWLNVKPV